MKELKKKISEVMRDYKLLWINEVKKSKEEKRNLSLSNIMIGEAELQNKLDIEILNAEERLKPIKKGLFK